MNIPVKGKGATYIQTTAPDYPVITETWFNPTDGYVRQWDGYSWKYVIGPGGSTTVGEGYVCSAGPTAGVSSSTERIAFPFESGVATLQGNLTKACAISCGWNSSVAGYISHGYDGVSASLSSIDKTLFNMGFATFFTTSNLSIAKSGGHGCNSSLYGYIFGASGIGGYTSAVEAMQFSNDSANCSIVGNLTSQSRAYPASCNSSIHGFAVGGEGASWTPVSYIDRVVFPFSGTASMVGNISTIKSRAAGLNSSIHGFACGGEVGNGSLVFTSSVNRLLFPFASGTATTVGDLAFSGLIYASGMNSTLYMYVNYLSTITKATFPFDSGVTTNVGNLIFARQGSTSIDSTDFVPGRLFA